MASSRTIGGNAETFTQSVHSTEDHSGVPGLPVTGFQILDNTISGFSDIATALADADTHTVFLKPGTYSFPVGTGILIPAGKQLIGLLGVNNILQSGISKPDLRPTGTISIGQPWIRMFDQSACKNIEINGTSGGPGGTTTEAIGPLNVGDFIWLDGISVLNWGQSGAVLASGIKAGRGRYIQCRAVSSRGSGWNIVTGGTEDGPTIYDSCVASSSTTGDGFKIAASTQNIRMYGCSAIANTSGHGFHHLVGGGTQNVQLNSCWARANIDGFRWTGGGGDGTYLTYCYAHSNSGWGFNMLGAANTLRGLVHSCTGRNNPSGNFTFPGGGWSSFGNSNAS